MFPPQYTRLRFGCPSSSISAHLTEKRTMSHPRLVSHVHQSSYLRFPTSTSLQCPDIIISYTNRFFYETAFGLFQAVEQAHSELFPNSLNSLTISIWYDMNIALLLPLHHCSHDPLQIAIAPHEDTPLLKRYIVFHLEQSWSHYLKNQRYMTILRESEGIWTFTNQQTSFLSSIGIDPTKVWFVPCYTDRRYLPSTYGYLTARAGEEEQSSNLADEDMYDVLIFGSYSSRRAKFVDEFLRNISISYSIKVFSFLSSPRYSLIHTRRDEFVRRSRVCQPPLPLFDPHSLSS